MAEVISLGALLPFLGVLTVPDRALEFPGVRSVAARFGITAAQDLLLPVTCGFIAAALVAASVRIVFTWCSTRFAFGSITELGLDVYQRTLYQPYQVHVSRNSSEVISAITIKVNHIANILHQLLVLISSFVLLAAIAMVLLAVDSSVALTAAAGFGTAYAVITWTFRNRLKYNAQRVAHESDKVVQALQEGLGAIRDVLLDGSQPLYCEVYRRTDAQLRLAQGSNIFISASPRYAIEGIGIVLIAVLAYGLSHRSDGLLSALPVLGTLALGAQRLLPVLQQGYAAWAGIVGGQASLADILQFLDRPLPPEAALPPATPLPLTRAIHFNGVKFRYQDTGPWILNGFDLHIDKGARIGIVGPTGSGKSTVLDLLMGLLDPTSGHILVDDRPITGERRRSWQRAIAHVPQNIYLSDSTFQANIAFGVPPSEVDLNRVRQVCAQARIADFIEGQPEGYEALVGERGVFLSGGQRQRIGIARALYKQAEVLVFDEATSALDNLTEHEVMDAINALEQNLTVVLVAHRLTTVRRCDMIVELGQGRVVAQGTYDQLLAISSTFRGMANIDG